MCVGYVCSALYYINLLCLLITLLFTTLCCSNFTHALGLDIKYRGMIRRSGIVWCRLNYNLFYVVVCYVVILTTGKTCRIILYSRVKWQRKSVRVSINFYLLPWSAIAHQELHINDFELFWRHCSQFGWQGNLICARDATIVEMRDHIELKVAWNKWLFTK